MPLDQQVGRFERNFDDSFDDLYRILEQYRAVIHLMGRERGIDGFSIYGDSAVRMSSEDRLRNILEELADACWYRSQGGVPASRATKDRG